jgi:hypothetical protein
MPETYDYERLVDYLTGTYGDRLYDRDGSRYPVIVFTPTEDQSKDVSSVLASEPPERFEAADSFAFYASDHLIQLQLSGRTLTDDVCYTFHRLEQDTLRIEGRLGRYFDMLATCDALEHELIAYAAGLRDDLPLRDCLHQMIAPEKVVVEGRGRSPALGVAVLTVFNDSGTYRTIIGQRSSSVATGNGLYHVVPAFIAQPTGPERFYAEEWALQHQIYREFGEELFGMPEYQVWDEPASPAYFYNYPAVADLFAMMNAGSADLHLTGIAVNLLSLRAEICALLLIRDPDWYARSLPGLEKGRLTERQAVDYISLDTLAGLPDSPHTSMTPHGAAAFWLGSDLARNLTQP